MAAILEERARLPDYREVNQRLCEVLAVKSGEKLLEVGSGSGVLCRLLAPFINPNGCIVGLDISPEMTFEAQKYASFEGVNGKIQFETAMAEALPHSSACFDCSFAARLMLHVSEPEQVIREMVRVVKPGGRVLVMDWDFDTITVDHPNREQTRRLLQWRSDHHGGKHWSGRQLWRQMQAAGLQNMSIHPWVTIAHREADGLTQTLWRAAQVACEGGAISNDEQEAWVKEIKDRIQAQSFFASIVYFIVKGFVVSK